MFKVKDKVKVKVMVKVSGLGPCARFMAFPCGFQTTRVLLTSRWHSMECITSRHAGQELKHCLWSTAGIRATAPHRSPPSPHRPRPRPVLSRFVW